MRSWVSIVLVALAGLVVLACGGDTSDGPPFGSGGTGGVRLTCATLENRPADCDKTCISDTECEASFCNSGVCAANCTASEGCGANASCNLRGRCIPNTGTGGTGASGGDICRNIEVTPGRSVPNVVFLVDQSGSMKDPFADGKNRWQAAHTAINGIVSSVDSIVRFGLTTYTSDNGFGPSWPDNPPFRECPVFDTEIDFALGNSDDIGDLDQYPYSYPSGAGADTPTGDSIDALVTKIQNNPPPNEGPTVIVLATDGAPDSCEYPNPSNSTQQDSARDEVVAAAMAAHAPAPAGPGIDTFVLWVGALTNDSIQNHLKEVANAGIGLPRATGVPAPANEDPETPAEGAPFWVGDQPERLQAALQNIVYDSISCEIEIDKPFNPETIAEACEDGVVTLNGAPLECNVDWQVKDEPPYNVIELLGTVQDPSSACGTFKTDENAELKATFPCGTVIVQ